MDYKVKLFAVIFVSFCSVVENASILALFPSLSFADHSVFRGYISLLAQRGHNIVLMTPYPGQFGLPEVERIVELNVGEESAPYWEEYKKLITDKDDYYPHMKAMNELNVKLVVAQLKSKAMTALLANPHVKFDLVVTDAENPILYALADKYKAPHIAITTGSGSINQFESKGVPVDPTLYPDVNSIYHRNISQWQKLVELNRHVQTRNEYYNNYLPLCEIAAKKLFAVKSDLLTLEKNIDMLFVANNPLLIGRRPSSPAVAYVDRLHVKPGFQLPEDLKQLLDTNTKGVIYFSMGAIQEPEHLSVKILQTLADAFKELPHLVLWKIANSTMIKTSENVVTSAWFPQQEILAHPNVKLFITHGGARSLEETVFYETPIVGLPIIKSRKVFIEEVIKHGAGEILDLYYLEKEKTKEVLTAVVKNEDYKKALIKLKNQIFDPVISGPEHAILWTEYVLRNGGARILQSPTADYSILRYLSADVLFVISVSIIFSLLLTYFLLRYIIRRIRLRILSKYDPSGKFKAL
ncbi:UDP-glycosyltransferase UGT5-like [Aricia agestis]|uniref:UDP-glycosyltransferase UGT5-like n=1 Tax=Aricia agestis TaxID=91739 RepID=UPI001C203529|nr:UDP-glycosyltransferase UGT5-like [Aricia agestis]